jgi:hypothetical protein
MCRVRECLQCSAMLQQGAEGRHAAECGVGVCEGACNGSMVEGYHHTCLVCHRTHTNVAKQQPVVTCVAVGVLMYGSALCGYANASG